jgi:hypothetical protein
MQSLRYWPLSSGSRPRYSSLFGTLAAARTKASSNLYAAALRYWRQSSTSEASTNTGFALPSEAHPGRQIGRSRGSIAHYCCCIDTVAYLPRGAKPPGSRSRVFIVVCFQKEASHC